MAHLIFFLTIIFSFCGCAKLAHIDQLLTLKNLSDEQGRQEQYVEAQDKKFQLLLEAVKDKSIERYKSKGSIVRKFGEPVFCEARQKDGGTIDFCLYRYAKKFFDSQKVYFYFDPKGKLIEWQYLSPSELSPQISSSQ